MVTIIGIGGIELLILFISAGFLFLIPLIALVNILRSRFEESNNKLVWVLVVLFLNLIGAILYYAIGRKQRVA